MVLRDDTAGTELPFATLRGLRECPLGEGAVALAASRYLWWYSLARPLGEGAESCFSVCLSTVGIPEHAPLGAFSLSDHRHACEPTLLDQLPWPEIDSGAGSQLISYGRAIPQSLRGASEEHQVLVRIKITRDIRTDENLAEDEHRQQRDHDGSRDR